MASYMWKNLISKSRLPAVPHSDVFWTYRFLEGYFSDTQKPPMVVAECPKIFDVQCIRGRIFVSLENIFVYKYL